MRTASIYFGKTLYIAAGVVFGLVILFPILWIVFTSLKSPTEMFRIPSTIIPTRFYIKNYIEVLGMKQFLIYFMNSFIVTCVSTIFNLLFAGLAAYAFSRFRFRGRGFMLACVILTQVMPGATILIPLYKMWVALGMINTRTALIVTYAVTTIPLSLWMLVGFLDTIPTEIDEAATIDGCSKLGVLYYILIPLIRPAIFASAIYVALNVWQEFLLAMTFTNTDDMRTLMVGLYSFVGEHNTNWGDLMAAAILTTIPVLCFFSATQKQFANGLAGAVKG